VCAVQKAIDELNADVGKLAAIDVAETADLFSALVTAANILHARARAVSQGITEPTGREPNVNMTGANSVLMWEAIRTHGLKFKVGAGDAVLMALMDRGMPTKEISPILADIAGPDSDVATSPDALNTRAYRLREEHAGWNPPPSVSAK
jgi:hypothetical protein